MSESSIDKQTFEGMTVLCVDDERIILRTLVRLFHKKQYKVLIANSAKNALEVMQQNNIDVVVSDMRMPEMDGAKLLEEVAKSHPNTYRIVLSGYADFESTVAAINLGKIHRFVNKPWDNDSLVSAVEEGLNLIYLKNENLKLRNKIEKQNQLLKSANTNLEDKVNLRTKQIRASLIRNDRDNKDCERMLFNFISINPNLSSLFAKNVGQLAVRLAKNVHLDKEHVHDIRLAGYLNEVGLLGLDPLYCNTPYRSLTYDQKTTFMNQGMLAEQILSPAQRLNGVKKILLHQYSPLKTITEHTENQDLLSCKIIIVARDYWRLATGRVDEKRMSHEEVLIELNKSRDTKYDAEILDILITQPELVNENTSEEGINALQLLPDMILKDSLYANNDLLILSEGHVFTNNSIGKLIEYEANQKQNFVIIIEKQD